MRRRSANKQRHTHTHTHTHNQIIETTDCTYVYIRIHTRVCVCVCVRYRMKQSIPHTTRVQVLSFFFSFGVGQNIQRGNREFCRFLLRSLSLSRFLIVEQTTDLSCLAMRERVAMELQRPHQSRSIFPLYVLTRGLLCSVYVGGYVCRVESCLCVCSVGNQSERERERVTVKFVITHTHRHTHTNTYNSLAPYICIPLAPRVFPHVHLV
jgi:hypothetical protein